MILSTFTTLRGLTAPDFFMGYLKLLFVINLTCDNATSRFSREFPGYVSPLEKI
jgi:hypothetical protein